MAPEFPFLNSALPLQHRIDDLVGRLTLLEKVSQLMHDSPAVERLGVPAYNWWNEACHGVGRSGVATVFPQVIGLGATWNRKLVKQVAEVVSDEARAKHHYAVSKGRRGHYQGLTFWTPNINIFRDPRWGRGQETFGEDPYLTGELGVATVQGLQGDNPNYLKTAACAKHFAVHSGPEADRHTFDAQPTLKDLYETYFPAFEKLVSHGVESVMGAYNRLLGEPCCGSKFLLVDTLRKKWGFKGHVVSDCGAIDDFHSFHKSTKTAAESAALAVRNGCDLNCGCTYTDLVLAVKEGLITESEIDTALKRLLSTRLKLGLFDAQESVPWSKLSPRIIDSPEHRLLSRKAAVESMVLLKNNGILPLRKDVESLLITGPTASSVDTLIGNYYGLSSKLVTIVEGIAGRITEGGRTVYRVGCALNQTPMTGINYTYPTAEEADVVVAVLGLNSLMEGEEGDTVSSQTGGDRKTIELPSCQLEFLIELRKHSKKLVLVLTGGCAIAIPEAHEICDAILQVWYPGCEGGNAVADVLFGDASPSGKLPITVPKKTSDLPAFDDYSMNNRTYRYSNVEPLYPFGFGLTYTQFEYHSMNGETNSLTLKESVKVSGRIRNVGSRPADEIVQCYVIPTDKRKAPKATLVDFTKVHLQPGEEVVVVFDLKAEAFASIDESGLKVAPTGKHKVVMGASSPSARSDVLGAPKPLEFIVSC